MARKSNEEPIVLDEGKAAQEVPTETSVEASGVEVPTETPIEQQVNVKPVKIHTLEEVDCWVGGNHYQLRKDRDHSVPPDVAAVLVNARKVYRI